MPFSRNIPTWSSRRSSGGISTTSSRRLSSFHARSRGPSAAASPDGGIRDAELFQVRLVLRRVIVVLRHRRPVLLQRSGLHRDGRAVVRADERDVLLVFRLDASEVIP